MKRNASLTALAAVAVALFGVSYLPRSGNPSQTRESAAANAARPARPKVEARDQVSCEETKKRLERFVPEVHYPAFCSESNRSTQNLPGDGSVTVAIAIVPDPVATHLPLLFDRVVEVLQQAAQDEQYSYDGSWLPWDTREKSYGRFDDEKAAEKERSNDEQQPGVLVFRSGRPTTPGETPYDHGLVVFLVAEQPTRGISDPEFEHALAWVNRLRKPTDDPLPVLGPTFSGTLASLARELKKNAASKEDPKVTNFRFASGSVSSELSMCRFRKLLNEKSSLHTYFGDDSIMSAAFLKHLDGIGYDLKKVAILSEDETAYGGDRAADSDACPEPPGARLDPKAGHPLHLYYPRDIASLRAAYEKQSIFSAGKQQGNANTPGTTLRGDLDEPSGSEHDTVRTYGGQLTPLAQESVLLAITDILAERRMQFVIIRSTNSLDQIFLGQFLRRAYPAGRLVFVGSDLLFRRGTEGSSLRGVMVLTPYPLFPWGQNADWPGSLVNQDSDRVFSDDAVEGLYFAARQLFHDGPSKEDAALEGYDPAIWVSVIGRRQFWPLALLKPNSDSAKTDADAANLLAPPAPSVGDREKPIRYTVELLILLGVSLSWAGWHAYCCWKGSQIARPEALAYFAAVPGAEHRPLILLGSGTILACAAVVAVSSGLFSDSLGCLDQVWLLLWLLAIVILTVKGCMKGFGQPRYLATQKGTGLGANRELPLRIGACVLPGLLGASVVYLIACKLTPATRAPLYLRNTYLVNGVAPLMPQVLLLGGLYAWFWYSLRGLALFGDDQPRLPSSGDFTVAYPAEQRDSNIVNLGRVDYMRVFAQEQIADPVEKAGRPFGERYLASLLFFFVFIATALGLALGGTEIRGLGERKFGILMFFWLTLYMAIVLADAFQLWRLWGKLRELLVLLDRTRLRRTLSSLSGLTWGSVWSMSGDVLGERYKVMSRQLESLRHLHNSLSKWRPGKANRYRRHRAQVILRHCMKAGEEFAKWYIAVRTSDSNAGLPGPDANPHDLSKLYAFERRLSSSVAPVMCEILLPAWQAETASLLLGPRTASGTNKDKDDDHAHTSSLFADSIAEMEAHVRAAEEYFVLPYLGFIQNTLGRMRTILLGTLWMFVATTLAVSSYPFDPLPSLGGMFLSVFVVCGTVLVMTFAQMHRDSTLSHIANTTPGELGAEFWIKMVTFGIGPLLGLLTTLFPSLTDLLTSWLQPGMEAVK